MIDTGDLRLDESFSSVVSVTPANGSSDQPVTCTIEILFSEPVNASTVEVNAGGALVSGNRELNGPGDRLTFTPSAPYPDFSTVSFAVTIPTNAPSHGIVTLSLRSACGCGGRGGGPGDSAG